jgi:hypothetical protein
MKLVVHYVDMRGGYGAPSAWDTDVIDEETGKKVGFVHQVNKPAERYISLFGGKYVGHFDDVGRCVAFAKGVEAVLNHALSTGEEQTESSSEAA